jgi:K+-transporting ATPase ATPase C chain
MRTIRPALILFVLLSLLTGGVYPAAVTGLAHLWFPRQAEGSLIVRDGQVVASRLIGQPFAANAMFWGRPSAPGGEGAYDAMASGGSNLARSNPAWLDSVRARVARLHAADPSLGSVPADLVTASGSALDPDVSPASAYAQSARVARARGLRKRDVDALIARHIERRFLKVFGEPVVNVVGLNLALRDAR